MNQDIGASNHVIKREESGKLRAAWKGRFL